MRRAEVSAMCSNDDAFDNTLAPSLDASTACLPVNMMMVLEATFFSLDISIIGHRIPAKINAFFQNLFNSFKHSLKVFLRNLVWAREGVNPSAPENFIGIDIANTRNHTLIHEHLLYLAFRLFLYLRTENWKLKIIPQRLRSKVLEVQRLFQFGSFSQCHFGKFTHVGEY